MMLAADLEADAALVAAAQADPHRFLDLYRRNVDFVHAFAWSRLGDRATAEDVTAETFRRALRALPRFEPRGIPFRAWLLRICANLVSDEHERRARTGRALAALATPPDLSEDAATTQIEERAVVQGLVAGLASDRRRVLELRFGCDLSLQATARAMGRSEGAVKQLQRRALDELRARMAVDDEEPRS
jgi:RNA polymerase sigma-70 factor (ECF subfamily)